MRYTDICPQTSGLNKPALKLEKFEESQAFFGGTLVLSQRVFRVLRVITREISQLSLDRSIKNGDIFGWIFWKDLPPREIELIVNHLHEMV